MWAQQLHVELHDAEALIVAVPAAEKGLAARCQLPQLRLESSNLLLSMVLRRFCHDGGDIG